MNQNGGIHKGGFAVLCHRNGGLESPGILSTRIANYVSLTFSQSPHYYRFSPVAVNTVIANFHIISRYINYFWHCIVWTKCYHSPIILIAEHVTMVSTKSITSIFQFFPCIQHSLSI